jgi:hypothetical protein
MRKRGHTRAELARVGVTANMLSHWLDIRFASQVRCVDERDRPVMVYYIDGYDGTQASVAALEAAYRAALRLDPSARRKWRTRDGAVLSVRAMTDEHVGNALRFLQRTNAKADYIAELEAEAKRRGLL